MMGTYKKGAINIALSIPIYFMIVISILMNKNALIFKTMICSLIYLVFMIIMYKLYSNKNEIVYNIPIVIRKGGIDHGKYNLYNRT